jgi:hypothetical protein
VKSANLAIRRLGRDREKDKQRERTQKLPQANREIFTLKRILLKRPPD